MKPLVSVIIDTYNYGQFIERAIHSVLTQEFPLEKIEIIVVDDGSTDNTRERVGKYGNQIRYIYKENGGQASAFNMAFKYAGGEIITLLDADDYWYSRKLKEIAKKFADDEDIGMVHHGVEVVNRKGKLLYTFPFNNKLDEGYVMNKVVNFKFISAPTPGLAFRRKHMERIMPIPELDFKIGADLYLVTQLPLVSKVGAIHERLACVVIHGSNNYFNVNQLYKAELNLSAFIGTYHAIDQRIAETRVNINIPTLNKIWGYLIRAITVEKYKGNYIKVLRLYFKLVAVIFKDKDNNLRQKGIRLFIDTISLIMSPLKLYKLIEYLRLITQKVSKIL